MGLRKKLISGEQGQALVEFSFICVILLMLAGGVADVVNIMRYQIALSGAATEVINQLAATNRTVEAIDDLCEEVISTNFGNSLGDGNTTFRCVTSNASSTDTIDYSYHNEAKGDWHGTRDYVPYTVTLERDQVLFSPVGQLVFGDSGNGGRRHMKVTAQTRVYMDMLYR